MIFIQYHGPQALLYWLIVRWITNSFWTFFFESSFPSASAWETTFRSLWRVFQLLFLPLQRPPHPHTSHINFSQFPPPLTQGHLRYALKKNYGIIWEFFPSGGPPPIPPFWEPLIREKKLSFILHFRPLGTFLVFTKKVKILPLFLHLLLGIGDPPPLPKFPKLRFFPRNERNQMNFRW